MNINLHIERLIVDEALLARGGRAALQNAVSAELTRLLSEGSLPTPWLNGGNLSTIRGGAIQVGQPNAPANLGAQIGQSIYGAFGGTADHPAMPPKKD